MTFQVIDLTDLRGAWPSYSLLRVACAYENARINYFKGQT